MLIFFDFGHFQGETGVGPQVLTLCPSLFHKNSNLSKNFQAIFLLPRVLLLVRILEILDHIWRGRVRVRKPPRKSHLTTTNPLRARNPVFWLNFLEFLDCIKNCDICHAFPYIASLVKFLYKLDHIWGNIPRKPPKIGSKWLLS